MLSSYISSLLGAFVWLLWLEHSAQAIELNPNDKNSVINAINIAATNAKTFYIGNEPGQTPGLLIQPYYWWECGGWMQIMIQRWAITGNDTYNDIITQAMLFQVGSHLDYTPANQSVDLGNDDQVFWGFAAMDAAELNFPNPPSDQPQWLALAQAVFNDQASVWDQATCNGGMRWQINPLNIGYDYKNIQSNGGFFHLAARLARYTGNQTYADAADKMWDWLAATPILEMHNDTKSMQVWDGIHIANCTDPEKALFTYNPATLIAGAAYMFNYTNGSSIWQDRLTALLNGMDEYFVTPLNGTGGPNKIPPPNGDILSEITIEWVNSDDQDQPSFKAFTLRWLAVATQLAPFTSQYIMPRIFASAAGAAQQCTGQATNQMLGTVCGREWYSNTWDGQYGVGEQLSALSAFQSLLIQQTKPPVTLVTGGTSQGNASAGGYGDGRQQGTAWMADQWHDPALTKVIGIGDTVGAAILTITTCILALGSLAWMIRSDTMVPMASRI